MKSPSGPGAAQIGIRSHIPELDGLRGLAILLVMVHHLVLWRHQQAACGIDRIYAYCAETGWAGVELFFVLSGYLITGILFDAKESPHYFRNFYARRVLRIFPLYYLILILLIFVFPALRASPGEFHQTVNYQWSYWLYLSNFTLVLPQSPFSQTRLVTWSLAIEEQFYLVWPAVIWLCDLRWAIRVTMGVWIVSITCRVFLFIFHRSAELDYYWTPSHLDGLAVGAIISLMVRSPGGAKWLASHATAMAWGGGTGTAAIASFSFIRHFSMRQDPLGQIPLYACMAVLGGSMLIYAINSAGFLSVLFRIYLLRFLGKYSYGLYLFHPIVLEWLLRYYDFQGPRIGSSRLVAQLFFLLTSLAISIIIALLSWNLVERHFLRLKVFFPETAKQ